MGSASPDQGFITDPINRPGDPSANIQNLIMQLLKNAGSGYQLGRGGVNPGILQRAFQAASTDMGGDFKRGSAPPVRAPGFSFYNQQWGPNDFSQFAKALGAHGISVGQFARAHPAAFASFNIDPRIRQLIAGTFAAPAGGMAHA